MKLEEAINHCKEVAKSKCDSCGAEHEQLAKWLIELKERRESNKHVSNYEAGYDNRCDKLFGKNGELVEFRKKQVLEGAFGIIRQHYKDKPNKMEAVAQLFGKQLCEEFTVSVPRYYEYGALKSQVIVKGWFGSRGFQSEQIDIADSYIFAELLEGGAVIVDDK